MAERGRSGPSPHSSEVAGPADANYHACSAASIRLVIASPVRLVREGLAASLQGRDGVEVIDAVSIDSHDIARIVAAAPDVVLVDLGQTDVVAAARLLKTATPAAKLVAFALDEIDADVFACAAAGFSGYVPRESGAEELHRALRDAVDGRMHCAPHIAAAMFCRLAALLRVADPRAALPLLTSRESEILALADEGCSNKEIARRLTISCATVKNHMHSILQKLQVTRRGQAVARLRACAKEVFVIAGSMGICY
jgi:two-component system, NarL family, nitrate/nitrite response regulator NarL